MGNHKKQSLFIMSKEGIYIVTEDLFELLTPFTVGAASTDNLTSAQFTALNTKLTTDAENDGLEGDNLDWGTAYLIADVIASKLKNGLYTSEKIGDYTYKKGSYADDGITEWMKKYNDLLASQMVSAPSKVAVRSDKDMSALGIDQNSIFGV